MLIVPLQPLPNQTVRANLASQVCQIDVYQKPNGLFMDLWSNDQLVISGVICQNLNRIVRSAYLGFDGDFTFIDNAGDTDPVYTGLGSRYSLAYLTSSELEEPR